MTDQFIDSDAAERHVSFWQHATTVMLVLGFIAAGWSRLNDCDLLNPDSPRYLIYAQSLADSGQYRAIDTPGAPLYTWRPPGLPALLVPVLWFRPYDIVAAKCVVLGLAALLLLAVHAIASSTRGGWSGPMMVALTATSPLLLSLSTEVLSEVPYALGILLVLYGLERWDQSKSGSRWLYFLMAFAALAYTPIIRTVGVALVVAAGPWSLSKLRRWAFLPAIALAIAGLGWLAWRSRIAGGNNYAGSLVQSIQEHGLLHVVTEALQTLAFYASAFPGVLLPGLTNEQPFYAPMVVGTLPSLHEFGFFAAVASLLMAAVAVIGLWQQRSRAGWVGLVYLILYTGCLAIWPWRHERFLWPMVPLIWAYFPVGCSALGRLFPSQIRAFTQPAVVMCLLSLCLWQSLGDAALISTNQRFLANHDAFYQEEAPGFYFSDWRATGDWIRENTAPHARILTWQAAVGETAHRYQRRVQFESLSPDKVRQQISSFPARYLVITTAQFGLGFGWQQVFADPAYKLSVVHQNRDVTILEVSPNRGGEISRTGYADWIQTQRTALDEVLARHPDRSDLLARKADLLQEQGQNVEALAVLESLIERGMVTVRICSTLGWLYFAEQKYELAAHYLELASGLPNAEPVAASLIEGANRARERLAEPADESTEKLVERSLRRITGLVSVLNFAAAERELDRILPRDPDHAELNYWRGYLHHIYGEREQAETSYQKAELAGSDKAAEKRLLLRLESALSASASTVTDLQGSDETIDPNTFASHVRLAKLYDEQGWSGRALATLESARQRFSDHPEILSPLAELYLRFACPEEALPLFKTAQQAWPHDKALRQGQAAAEAALRVPDF
ncbi:MAG: tetratricopeptide repeat protein [Schlesneria sp.]|nr:tetratricopeptide repeat protein [Schlesneria sp.]